MCVCVYVCVYMCECVCVCMYACMYVCTYVCACMYVCVHALNVLVKVLTHKVLRERVPLSVLTTDCFIFLSVSFWFFAYFSILPNPPPPPRISSTYPQLYSLTALCSHSRISLTAPCSHSCAVQQFYVPSDVRSRSSAPQLCFLS